MTPKLTRLMSGRTGLLLCLLAAGLLSSVGCHRSYYRLQADEEVTNLIREKASDPRWDLPGYDFQPDPRSRMYSGFSEDHPPMPPDDATANQYMQWVDGKPGYPHWHANGDTRYVANPEWEQYLPRNETGEVVLSMQSAYRLALLHSREYQRQRENLYLSALDVSLERFNFESQLFAGYDSFFTNTGSQRAGGPTSVLNSTTGTRGIRMEKLGIAGSTLVVGLANSLLWQYAGPDTHTATTLIDFSLIQPLLRGAGRDRILESLTVTERGLLANVRQMERYRRGYHLQVTVGRGAGPGPSTGLASISNSSGPATSASGYLGLLQTQQNIQIQEANVASLRSVVAQFKAFVAAGRTKLQQLQFVQSSLYNAQAQLLASRNNYETTLDRFKIDLGLPPDIEVVIDDTFLDQFQLIDAEMTARQNRLTDLQDIAGNSIVALLDMRNLRAQREGLQMGQTDFGANGLPLDPVPEPSIDWSPEVVDRLEQLLELLATIQPIHEDILVNSIPEARQDVAMLQSKLQPRVDSLQRLRDRMSGTTANQQAYDIEPEVLADTQLIELPEQLLNDIAFIETRLLTFGETLEQVRENVQYLIDEGDQLDPVALATFLESDVLNVIPTELRELAGLYLELSLAQVSARTDSILLNPVDVTPEQAVEIARSYRRDWMNARTALVDTWRQIEFVADQLEADFDLVFEGDLQNFGDNPVDLRSTTGRLRAGFQFDSPITRLAERNNYREALINYTRRRRDFYAFEDEINRSLRQTLRNIEQIKYNFEITRRAVKIAVQRVDQTQLELRRPQEPRSGGDPFRQQFDTNTARNLLDALNDLQRTQINFLGFWVNFETQRRNLDFDMGTMELDEEGQWVDPGDFSQAYVQALLSEAATFGGMEDVSDYPEVLPEADFDLLPSQQDPTSEGEGELDFEAPRMLPPGGLDPDAIELPGEFDETGDWEPLPQPTLTGPKSAGSSRRPSGVQAAGVELPTSAKNLVRPASLELPMRGRAGGQSSGDEGEPRESQESRVERRNTRLDRRAEQEYFLAPLKEGWQRVVPLERSAEISEEFSSRRRD